MSNLSEFLSPVNLNDGDASRGEKDHEETAHLHCESNLDCARLRPLLIPRFVQIKHDTVDNIDGPFIHTKIPWATMVTSGEKNYREKCFPLSSKFAYNDDNNRGSQSGSCGLIGPSVEERILNLETIFKRLLQYENYTSNLPIIAMILLNNE